VTMSSGEGDAARPQDIAAESLAALEATRPGAASALARFIAVVADEAKRSSGFANRLERALTVDPRKEPAPTPPGKRSRRPPGPWDPYAVFAELGEDGLRRRLEALDLEQLRDIVAEHGMDSDRLAMKWRDASRVVDRIAERVVDRAGKGEGFRRA
jgi:hypothetical protein